MKDPIVILVKNEELTLEGIKQFFCEVPNEDNKKLILKELFKMINIGSAIVYVNTKQKAEIISEYLKELKCQVGTIHADMEQSHRNMVMQNFRNGVTRYLVSTDLLARGIDVQQCNVVINYELPQNFENYIHRIGRSGRYGKKGTAINLIVSKDKK